MGNIDHRHIQFFCQPFYKTQKRFNLPLAKRCRRFIQDQQPGNRGICPHDLYQLLFPGSQLFYRNIQRDFYLEMIPDLLCFFHSCFSVYHDPFHDLTAKTDILCRCHIPDQVPFLIHHIDSCLHRIGRPFESCFFSLYFYMSLIYTVSPCKHFTKRTFTGSVFSDQGMNLIIADLKADMVNRCNPCKSFCNSFYT